MRRKGLLIAAVVVLVAVGALGLRVAQVHSEGGEWRLSPSAAPPRIHVLGRDYTRSRLAPEPARDAIDPTGLGRTGGGGMILLLPGHSATRPVPTVIQVYDGHELWTYELVGGP